MRGVRIEDRGPGTRDLRRQLQAAAGLGVMVGVRGQRGQDLVTYAAANEFGVPGRIPERSFLRSTVREQRTKYAQMLRRAIQDHLAGQGSVREGLGRLGMTAVADVQRKIVTLRTPPNAPSTIRRKGSSNPLIDTGRLRQSIDWVFARRRQALPQLDRPEGPDAPAGFFDSGAKPGFNFPTPGEGATPDSGGTQAPRLPGLWRQT